MNILCPIVANVILAMILIAGGLIGAKRSWKLQLFKLVCLGGIGIGAYYLIPFVNNILMSISFLSTISEGISLNSFSFALAFFTLYTLLNLFIFILKRCLRHKHDRIGASKIKTSKLPKSNKKIRNMNRKPLNIIGVIFGVLISMIMSFVILLPIKDAVYAIADSNPVFEEVANSYDKTIYGIIDNATGFSDLIGD